MSEEWREVPGYPDYEVSDQGRVRSWVAWHRLPVPRLLKLTPELHGGYPGVSLRGDRKKVHHLVLEAFVAPRPEGMLGCHRNGCPTDNTVGNLYWGTPSENTRDMYAHGRGTHVRVNYRGEKHAATKLTAAQVLRIRRDYIGGHRIRGGSNAQLLATKYKVHVTTIYNIVSRKTWGHVE